MKTLSIKITLFFTILLLLNCVKSEELSPEMVYIRLNEKSKTMVGSTNAFGMDIFKAVVSFDNIPGKNVMVSPLSVSLAMSMIYNGANGATKTAMENTMRLNNTSVDEININFKQVTEALLSVDSKIELSIANSIWYRNTFSVLPYFIEANHDFYNAEVNALNFNDPNSKNIINSWVANNTNNKIDKIIEEINPEDVMFLINAIYFKGVWKYQFDASKNFKHLFTLSNGSTKQIEMMDQKSKIRCLYSKEFQMIELPYGQGNWAMDLILPVSDKPLNRVISEFTVNTWDSLIYSLSEPTEVSYSIPPFKFEYESDLNQVLTNMGMGVAFDAKMADFSKINNESKLYISKVKHKTFVEVNEKGTEAAAVTSVGIGMTGSMGQSTFVFDKPFIFVIREISTGLILFIGKVENPAV